MKKTVLLLILILVCALTFGLAACGEGGDLQASVDSSQGSVDGGDSAACEHQWQAATCLTPKTCSLCGETEGKALGHTFGEKVITQPTCTEAGAETRECTLCGTTQTLRTFDALGHTRIHGICSRCEEEQNNVYVALNESVDGISGCVSDLTSAASNYSTATDMLLSNMSTYYCLRYFDSYYGDMLRDLIDMHNKIVFIQARWMTEKYHYPYEAIQYLMDTLEALTQTSQYKNYFANKSYSGAGSLASVTGDYLRDLLTKAQELYAYCRELSESEEYTAARNALTDDNIRYDGSFYLPTSGTRSIIFSSFKDENETTSYTVKLTDGEHSYSAEVADVSGGIHSAYFGEVTLNADSVVQLIFYGSDGKLVAGFTLYAHDETKTESTDNTETADDSESLDNALVGFTS